MKYLLFLLLCTVENIAGAQIQEYRYIQHTTSHLQNTNRPGHDSIVQAMCNDVRRENFQYKDMSNEGIIMLLLFISPTKEKRIHCFVQPDSALMVEEILEHFVADDDGKYRFSVRTGEKAYHKYGIEWSNARTEISAPDLTPTDEYTTIHGKKARLYIDKNDKYWLSTELPAAANPFVYKRLPHGLLKCALKNDLYDVSIEMEPVPAEAQRYAKLLEIPDFFVE